MSTATATLRVVIADDHPLFRVGLAYGLRAEGFEIVGEAPDGKEAVRLCLEVQPDAALFDVKMPGLNGIDACKQVVAGLPAVRVLLLTTFSEAALVESARAAGAVGFLSKETEPQQLAAILRRVTTDSHARLFPKVDLPKLTTREIEVLKGLAAGLTNKEIARHLGLSPETVKDFVLNIYRKLEVEDRVTAANQARALGLA